MNVLNRKRNSNQKRKGAVIGQVTNNDIGYQKFKEFQAKKKRIEDERQEVSLHIAKLLTEIKGLTDSDLVRIYAIKEQIHQAQIKFKELDDKLKNMEGAIR